MKKKKIEKIEEEKKIFYYMQYNCSNCGKDFMESFEYGTRAEQGECPHCGVSPIRRGEVHWIERF